MARTHISLGDNAAITFRPYTSRHFHQLGTEAVKAVYRALAAPCEKDGGPLHAIKLVREVTGCDMAAAKDVVDFLRDAIERSQTQYEVDTMMSADAWEAARYAHSRVQPEIGS